MRYHSKEDIIGIIPHRSPFLLVDSAHLIDEKTIVGYKYINDKDCDGHFPGNPIFPGVLMIEGMAQTAGILSRGNGKDMLFSSIEEVKFRKIAIPGQNLEFHIRLIKSRVMGNSSFYWFTGETKIGDDIYVTSKFSAVIR